MRDPFFDNAKLLAVVLVVWGHSWGPLVGDPEHYRGLRAAYLVVYLFHMPLFIMICGWFSRSFAENASHPARLRRLLTSTVVPYLIFATAYTLQRNYRTHWEPMQLLRPWYLTWFLVALFVWRVTAPIWRIVKYPVAVAAVAMLAVGATEPSGDLVLGQVLQFLPFFVLGLTVSAERLRQLRESRALRWAAVPVFVLAFVACYWLAPRIRTTEWLFHRSGHEHLHVSLLHWMGVTLLIALVGLALSLAFLSLVPRGENRLTSLGAGSQYTYLLHGFLVQAVLGWGGYKLHLWSTWPGYLLLSALGAAVALLCATAPVRRLLRWAVEPEMRWAFKSG
ncbi:acyltransferase family protein [Peterkaempfera sp. SMS 1(5)a]|uniref:acyltransferase family protein n=1 Tax=Peterkaempfera podocarpi TaxID=3232308 RepID=UPI00366B2596